MKRKKLLCAGILAALLLSGCAEQQNAEYIGKETAKQLALSASGISSADAGSVAADMQSRSGTDYYRVTFTADGKDYEYAIDAVTGVVIESQTPDSADSKKTSGDQTQDSKKASSGQTQDSKSTSGDQTQDDKNTSGTDTHGKNTSGTGAQVSKKASNSHAQGSADNSSGTNSAAASQSGNIISASRAKQLALAQVPGASERDIHEFEVDNDDGRIEYEGKIYYNNMEYEFEIDAYSGAFRSWEAEPIDD